MQKKQHVQGVDLEGKWTDPGKNQECGGQRLHGIKTRNNLCGGTSETKCEGQKGGKTVNPAQRIAFGRARNGTRTTGGQKRVEKEG